MLNKKELYRMIINQCGTNKASTILRMIREKTGRSVSRDFLVTMPNSNKGIAEGSANTLADFLGIKADKIASTGENKLKNNTWEFSIEAQRMAEVSKLWVRSA